MSPLAAPPPDVDAFLDRLHAADYGVGVRERLLAHALLARYAESGRLPEDPADQLGLLEPLLSRNEQEQRRFESIVTAFLRLPRGDRIRTGGDETGIETQGRKWRARIRRRIALVAFATLALMLVAALVGRGWRAPTSDGEATVGPGVDKVTGAAPVALDSAPPVSPIYVPLGTFPDADELAPGAARPGLAALRWGVGGLGTLLALALVAWLVRRRRRVAYLQGVRTDEELEEHVLRDPDPLALRIPDAAVRPASRMLRQRIAGSRAVLDLRATLHATMRGGGALSARYRSLHQTPEYLVLVDRVSARDHQAAFHELLVDALSRYGVAVDLFYYEGSPARGCWRPRLAQGEDDPGTGARMLTSVAHLSNRYGGHRLLVFGDAACAFEPLRGGPAAWVQPVGQFASRAWFTSLPASSWGPAEAGVDGLGFLLLPAQPESLEALGAWLASDRAMLRADADWPGAYPPSLRGGAAAWVARQTPPPEDAQEDLLYELRAYLGPVRFQWLCACAVFPAVSWPLTLSLGRELLAPEGGLADGGALARGVAALGALPWFRYGRMPAWLRESLLDRVDPEQEQRLRGVVERRLAAAMQDGPGATLAEVAVRRRMFAWFARRRGMARDVVLAGFLERGLSRRLAQRMPRPLQRLLFRDGKALYGLRGAVPAVGAAMAVLCGVAVMPGVWEAWTGTGGGDRLAMEEYAYAQVGGGIVESVAFSPDGQRVLATVDDGTVQVWPVDLSGEPVVLRVSPDGRSTAAWSPDGQRIVTASPDEAVQVWRADGRGTPVAFREHSGETWSRTFASFSPDGRWIAAISQDTTVRVWRADGYGEPLVLSHRGPVNSVAFSPDAKRIITASDDSMLVIRKADGSGDPINVRHSGPVNSAAFSPDGRWILTISLNTIRVLTADADQLVVFTRQGSVSSAAFSPDGQRIVLAGDVGGTWVSQVGGSGITFLRGDVINPTVSASFSPDGQRIVTVDIVGNANSVRMWRADGVGEPIELGSYQPVNGVAFSPDGERIVTAGGSRVRLWGRRPGVSVNVRGCLAPTPDADVRSLADRLAQDTLFAPFATTASLGTTLLLALGGTHGDVLYALGDVRSQAAAERLVARLNFLRGGDRLYQAKGVMGLTGALSVDACTMSGTLSGVLRQAASNVFVYYKAATDSALARQVAEGLRVRGNRVGIVAHRPNAANTGAENVRYFRRENQDTARVLAGVVQSVLAANGVQGFEPQIDDRSAGADSASLNHFEVWLPDLSPWKPTVRIQVHSRETDRAAVLEALRDLGFPLSTGVPNAGVPADMRTNAIWYGTGVRLEEVRQVALTLMRSGVEIRMIAPFSPPRRDGEYMIQVGSLRGGERYGSSTLRARPYSVAEVQAATRFPIP